MAFDWIKKQAQLYFLADDFDFSEADAGWDLALRPEIIRFLTEQTFSEKFVDCADYSDGASLYLDEHELAIG